VRACGVIAANAAATTERAIKDHGRLIAIPPEFPPNGTVATTL
jgi:hypothetical protein